MKIAFWSPWPGRAGTTSNMLVSAVMVCAVLKKKIFLLHSHYSDTSMEKAVLGRGTGQALFEDIGLDSLLRNIKLSELSKNLMEDSVISLLNNRFNILPGTDKGCEELFETEMEKVIPVILNTAVKYYDLVFMDLVSGGGKISKIMLEEADFVMVNLTQDTNDIDEYFVQYHMPIDKTLFLIGRYNRNSRYNVNNLERSYPCIRHRTAVIPYNVGFMDAFTEGKLIRFTMKNLVSSRSKDNQYFIHKIKQAVDLMDKTLMKAGGSN